MILVMESSLEWGTALRVVRAARSLDQQEVATAADIDPSYLSLLERDHRTPSIGTVSKLCSALGVAHSDLARIAEDPAAALGIGAAA